VANNLENIAVAMGIASLYCNLDSAIIIAAATIRRMVLVYAIIKSNELTIVTIKRMMIIVAFIERMDR